MRSASRGQRCRSVGRAIGFNFVAELEVASNELGKDSQESDIHDFRGYDQAP